MKVELYFYDSIYGDHRVFNNVKDVKVVDNGKWCRIEIPAEGEMDEVYLFRVDDIRQIHCKSKLRRSYESNKGNEAMLY